MILPFSSTIVCPSVALLCLDLSGKSPTLAIENNTTELSVCWYKAVQNHKLKGMVATSSVCSVAAVLLKLQHVKHTCMCTHTSNQIVLHNEPMHNYHQLNNNQNIGEYISGTSIQFNT